MLNINFEIVNSSFIEDVENITRKNLINHYFYVLEYEYDNYKLLKSIYNCIRYFSNDEQFAEFEEMFMDDEEDYSTYVNPDK